MEDKTAMRRLSSVLGSLVLGASLVIATVLGLLALPVADTKAQEPVKNAHVVVMFDDGRVVVRPITFTGEISGLTALELAGLDVVSDHGNVCAIEGLGCPATDCFCPNNWWQQSYWIGDAWQDPGWPPPPITTANAVDGWAWGHSFPTVPPPAPPITAASAALEWLRPQQSDVNGSYSNNTGATLETLFAVSANGLDAAGWRRQPTSPSLLSYLISKGAAYANSGAAPAGKLAVGLAAGDGCWPIGAMSLTRYYSPTTGAFYAHTGPASAQAGTQAWAMLGMRAISQTIPSTATQHLKDIQQADGGWEWQATFGSDTNTTALAVQTLVAAGEPLTSTAIVSGLNYLEFAQNDDGGFAYDPDSPWGTGSDTNSTAYAVQALLASGESPVGARWITYTGGITPTGPISYLLNMQLSDGSFEWQPGYGSNQLATQQAVPALLGRPFPLRVSALAQCYGSYLPIILK